MDAACASVLGQTGPRLKDRVYMGPILPFQWHQSILGKFVNKPFDLQVELSFATRAIPTCILAHVLTEIHTGEANPVFGKVVGELTCIPLSIGQPRVKNREARSTIPK